MIPMASPLLRQCFRWYGPQDPVTLRAIRQCGAEGVYSALHQIPYGETWTREAIRERKAMIEAAGLTWDAVESVPVSEAIRAHKGPFEEHLENYRESLKNLGAEGVSTVIYNFMPVLDWVRTDLAHRLDDGAECLRFDPVHFAAFEIHLLEREHAADDYTPEQLEAAETFVRSMTADELDAFGRRIIDSFPGCKMGFTLADVRRLLDDYAGVDTARLREHYRAFLEAVVPAAEEAGVRLAVHPDDPPFPILGLPRIVSTEADLAAVVEMVPSPANGLCFCTGSLSARRDNDLPGMIRRLGAHIHTTHLRSVEHEPDGSFHEARHLEGSVPMPQVVAALLELNGRREPGDPLCFRPDHGHRMLDDLDKPANPNPGYDALGRMRGLAEIRGLQLGLAARL